jgi:hypothetical protein
MLVWSEMRATNMQSVFVHFQIAWEVWPTYIEVTQTIQSTGQSTYRKHCRREKPQPGESAGSDPGFRGTPTVFCSSITNVGQLIRGKRNFTRTAVHAAPRPFLFIALNASDTPRLTMHLVG